MKTSMTWLFALLVLVSMCNTDLREKEEQRAVFLKICKINQDSANCNTYFFTQTDKKQLSKVMVDSLLENNKKYFVGEENASHEFLKYINKDTINLVIHEQ